MYNEVTLTDKGDCDCPRHKFKQFNDLHLHSYFSLLDSVSSPEENVKRAKELGMTAVGITDHGSAAGIYDHYFACKKHGLIPVLGNELYFKEDTDAYFKAKEIPEDDARSLELERLAKRKYFHGCFYAINKTGYKNLLRLSSLGFNPDRYQYGRPVVSIKDILENSEGLAYSTGCMIGIIGTAQKEPLTEEETERYIQIFKEAFKDRMFIEIGPAQVCFDWDREKHDFVHRIDGCLQEKHNHRAIKMAHKYNIPLIVASDGHMARPELKKIQDIMIKSGREDGWHFKQIHAMLGSDETWAMLQQYHPYIDIKTYEKCIDNTFLVSDMVRGLELKFSPKVPKFPLASHPYYREGMRSYDLLLEIVRRKNRIKDDPIYVARLVKEIEVICNNGLADYSDYFIILEDLVRAAKDMDCPVGPGRGSVGGSLLAYAMGITQIDPIKYNLLFERFLSKNRLGVPNIDFNEFTFDKFKQLTVR